MPSTSEQQGAQAAQNSLVPKTRFEQLLALIEGQDIDFTPKTRFEKLMVAIADAIGSASEAASTS